MTSYVSTGIAGLDGMIGGGMLPGNSYLLEVETGTEELAFIAAYMNEGLRQRELCVIVLYDMPHEDLITKLANLNVDMKGALSSGSLVIADLWGEGKYDPERQGPILMTQNLNDPNSILRIYYDLVQIRQREMKRGAYTGSRVAVYSISSEIMNYKFEPTYKLAKVGLNAARQQKAVALTLLHPRMFDETIVAAFEHLNDGVIVLSMKEVGGRFGRFIRVKQSPLAGFYSNEVPYEVVSNTPLLTTSYAEPFSTFRSQLRVDPDGGINFFGSRYVLADAQAIEYILKFLTDKMGFEPERAVNEIYSFSKEYGRAKFNQFLSSVNLRVGDLDPGALLESFAAFISTLGVGMVKVDKFTGSLIALKVFNCICAGQKSYGGIMHSFLAGVIAAVAESILNRSFACRETKCIAESAGHCEFVCQASP